MYKIGDKLELNYPDSESKTGNRYIKRTGTIIGITENLVIMEFKYKKGPGRFVESFLLREFSDYVLR